jgi:uncharacterized protein YceH (UPF0502 family)
MNIDLTLEQARVLGCLLEKEMATPDYYPMTLNSLMAACNQKSNRDPVLKLSEQEVQVALDYLIRENLAGQRSDFSSRVPRYGHRLTGTVSRPNAFSRAELAILSELLVRGPQTPGELRTRAARMQPFDGGLDEVNELLVGLATSDPPVVTELPRQSGRREARYACLWMAIPEAPSIPADNVAGQTAAADYEARLSALEEKVSALTTMVQSLQR